MAADRLSPFWTTSPLRSKSTTPSPGPESSRDDGKSISGGSSDLSSAKSTRTRGRTSIKRMMKRIRSSSNLTSSDQLLMQPTSFKEVENWYTGFQLYNMLITTRFSSNDTEYINDISKACSTLSKNCGGQFIHGLPESVFDLALLWCPAKPLKRTNTTQPTWSWLGWEGRINFPFDPTSCPDVPRNKDGIFRSEILQYHIGTKAAPYTIRREKKDTQLRIQYPPYFHAPRGHDTNISDTLRFSAQTISAEGFTAEQLHYEEEKIPCSQLINNKYQLCGVIMDFEESISEPSTNGPYEFVLLSRNLRSETVRQPRGPVHPTTHPSGTPIWNRERFSWSQEVVDFNEDIFSSGPWKMLNVMLIRWVGEYAERVAVARIHEEGWLQCNPVKKDIVLR
ncbi:hypothetical protein B0J11DRAFT_160856 [Dendryphion nanum]|uniref:Uncharacterized protein n=1 Tax=Dendryphion nanum TaxID=256645 RepID=A0A9P9EE79_9PLEO|nr:hypothetical protein B0J11DRAFT_160856 [Dendryphion nanum]